MPRNSASVPRGPALTFDPRYVDYLIRAWQKRRLEPIPLPDLQSTVAQYIEHELAKQNEMGMLEEEPSNAAITKAVTLLKALKLIKQTLSGPRDARISRIAPTTDGLPILDAPVATGGIRPQFVHLLVARSPELKALLRGLETSGDLVLPSLSPTDEAPRRGPGYARALENGLASFSKRLGKSQPEYTATIEGKTKAKKPTPKQQFDAARKGALQSHPVGQIKQIEKLLSMAEELGLIWSDTQRINEVVTSSHIGLAAQPDSGSYAPKAPTWDESKSAFIEPLQRVKMDRADSTGFVTIEALRGGLGHALHLSSRVVDALICAAREAGERGESPVTVHFEEDEEQMYKAGRRPLVWKGRAFDFVEVKAPSYLHR